MPTSLKLKKKNELEMLLAEIKTRTVTLDPSYIERISFHTSAQA